MKIDILVLVAGSWDKHQPLLASDFNLKVKSIWLFYPDPWTVKHLYELPNMSELVWVHLLWKDILYLSNMQVTDAKALYK